jgi:predicted transcriptional regulator
LRGISNLLASAKKQSSIHRGRLDIIADILGASFGGVRKTYLMYRCNLSFKQLKYYLEFLLHKKLLQMVGDNKKSNPSLFKITRKGKKFLQAYKGLKSLMK